MEDIKVSQDWHKYLLLGIKNREKFDSIDDVLTMLIEEHMSKRKPMLVMPAMQSTQGCPVDDEEYDTKYGTFTIRPLGGVYYD